MSSGVRLGSELSLLSRSEIRYEGILYAIDSKENTFALAKVKAFGTEGRCPQSEVPPCDEIYEFIIFRASDIKELHLKSSQPNITVLPSGLTSDPAIVQHSGMIPCSLHCAQSYKAMCGASLQQLSSQMAAYNIPLITNRTHTASNRSATSQTSQRKNTMDAGVQVSEPIRKFEKEQRNRSKETARISFADNVQMRTTNQLRSYVPNRRFQRGRGPRRGRGRGRGGSGIRNSEILKFDCEYDFELANAEFIELENKLSKNVVEMDEVINEDADEDSIGYDKARSFFDNISCEASRTAKGIPRFDWRVEKKLNVETFGVPASMNWLYRRRGRGNFRRGGRGRGAAAPNKATGGDVPKTVTFGEKIATVEIERPETPMEASKTEDIPVIEMVEPKEVWVEPSEDNKDQWK